ncbi:MAG: right-handed parallel beta-helix repeat-containing protein, partial [Candidatus Gracilibacteria bacterium]|nr:right-handed parallel beta-helix repeat-containing protein [Candidatus Gracilibacteria bacterium]
MKTIFNKKFKAILISFGILFLTFFFNFKSQAEITPLTYYFNQSNANELQKMIYRNFRFAPGDKIVFKAGTIKIKDVGRWGKINYLYGTKDKPIIIEGETGPNGELLTTLDGAGFDLYGDGSNSRDLLGIESGQYVIIRNIRFLNSWNSTGNAGGIRFVKGDNLVVENCEFNNTQNGVFTYGSGKITIKNSLFNRAGYFPGGGHAVYLENKEVYFIGNHVINTQYSSFRTRASFTYMEGNYIENRANTEVTLFGGATTADPNSNVVMIGNVIIKTPSSRDDGQPGNKYQFIQIGQRTTPFSVYAYDNTFILDQDKAIDTGSDQKNYARLIMFSDASTNQNAKIYLKNNVIYGSNKLADNGQQGIYGEFENNIYMSGSVVPNGWTATGNITVNDSSIFKNYVLNTSNGLSIDGLKLAQESLITPIPATDLKFVDVNGVEHSIANGLYNDTNFSYHFEKGPRQMVDKQYSFVNRCSLKSIGFADNNPDSNCSYPDTVDPVIPPSTSFTGFSIVGDSAIYNSLNNIPTGKWQEINATKLIDVLSPRSYNLPINAVSGPTAIMGARSSAAFDTKREKMYVWGGGHTDYAGNEVYSFDLNTLKRSRLTEPTFPPQGQALIETGASRYYDGNPIARSTYDMIEYDPNTDQMCALGEFNLHPSGGGKQVNCLSLANNTWIQKQDIPYTVSIGVSAYDEKSGNFYEYSSDSHGLLEYNPTNDTWKKYNFQKYIPAGGRFTADIDTDDNIMFGANSGSGLIIHLPETGFTGSVLNADLIDIFGNDTTGRDPGVIYDKIAKKFVVWGGGKYLYVINPSDWSYEKINPYGDITPGNEIETGTYGRLRYSAKYDVYILANGIDKNVWIYKPDRTSQNKIGQSCNSNSCPNNSTNQPNTGTNSGTTNTGSTNTGTVNNPNNGVSNGVGITYTFNTSNFSTFKDKFFGNLKTNPGDKFVFASGTYNIKNVSSWPKINNLSGSLNNPIIIEGEVGPNGELLTTFDGAGIGLEGNGSNARDLLDIENSNYVIVRNIRFKNASNSSGNAGGIRFVYGDNLIVDNCYFENNNNGVFAYKSGKLTIKNSEFNKNGHYDSSGGGHGVYIETTEFYFIGNHMYNSQVHNFRSRAGFTYMQNNYIENAANTEISLFGGNTTTDQNANFVMIGNVIIKAPSQRDDGAPGNKYQFIQIGERTTPFSVYAYDNTFILDQAKALDTGSNQKNYARLIMFSDKNTNDNAKIYLKNNVIYGSNKLADNGQQGSYGEFENNIYVSGSVVPTGWNTSGNLALNDSSIFKNYVLNSSNELTLSGLLLNNPNLLSPISQSQLKFVDKSGTEHSL